MYKLRQRLCEEKRSTSTRYRLVTPSNIYICVRVCVCVCVCQLIESGNKQLIAHSGHIGCILVGDINTI